MIKFKTLVISIIILITLPFTAMVNDTIDLTVYDIYIKQGFSADWLLQLPSGDDWIKVPGSKTGYRSLVICKILTKTSSIPYKPSVSQFKDPTFSMITHFPISDEQIAHKGFLGMYLATIGDNWSVYLNGHLLRQEVYVNAQGKVITHRMQRKVVIQIDKSFLHEGDNILAFVVTGEYKNLALGMFLGAPYIIGDYDELFQLRSEIFRNVLMFTYFIVGCFFIFMYFRRKKSTYNFAFGLSCIFIFSYFFSRSALIQPLILDSLIILRIEYVSLFFLPLGLMAFVDRILHKTSGLMFKSYRIFSLLCVSIVLFSSVLISDQILKIWQMSSVFPILYILGYRIIGEMVQVIKSLYAKQQSESLRPYLFIIIYKALFETTVGILLIGSIIFTSTIIIDITSSLLSTSNTGLAQYGFFIFMMSNAAVLISKFVHAQTRSEQLSLNLETEVEARTSELEMVNEHLALSNVHSLEIMEELEVARDKADKASQAKSEFLANMSHEIRTPMNGVVGMIELLQKTNVSENQKQYLDTAKSSAESLLTLINDILDFSKIEARKLELESIVFNLHTLIDGFSELFSVEFKEKGLVYQQNISSDVPELIKGDPNRLKQILTNFISNALKFTSKGKVSLALTLVSKSPKLIIIHFSVMDTGIGISEENTTTLFKKFTQADNSITRQYGGTGLGLAISEQLVNAMQGTIGVNSTEGVGSEFWFTSSFSLPEKADKSIDVEKSYSDNQGIICGKKILVAEDNITNQLVVKSMLRKLKAEVTIANNGKEAIELLSDNTFDLILMDMQMPEMDGLESTIQIRSGKAGEENKSIIIIAVTANAMSDDKKKCMVAGMNDFITKPITFDSLTKQLLKWL